MTTDEAAGKMEAVAWIVTHDSECDGPEFFLTEKQARENACLGVNMAYVTPLYRALPATAGWVSVPRDELERIRDNFLHVEAVSELPAYRLSFAWLKRQVEKINSMLAVAPTDERDS